MKQIANNRTQHFRRTQRISFRTLRTNLEKTFGGSKNHFSRQDSAGRVGKTIPRLRFSLLVSSKLSSERATLREPVGVMIQRILPIIAYPCASTRAPLL